ncbi:MAG TPA: type II toxin-antitoxin system prevent-host-death family antitoxin [Gemmatimonadota bacterium]|nr:type II toxin-antitoxin system prevent-host-death family antitoxin [Gemmatimonadota bacterium]
MHAVGIRELKNRLSEYLRLVRAGERVLVTDRGEVIAELGPPGEGAGQDEIPRKLQEMIREGLATRALPRGDYKYPRFPRLAPDGTAERLIDEERGDR